MYSIDNKQSFDSLTSWLAIIKSASRDDLPIALLGNKSDLESLRKVPITEAQSLLLSHSLHSLYETSALTGENVVSALYCLLQKVIELKSYEPNRQTITLSSSQKRVVTKSKCC